MVARRVRKEAFRGVIAKTEKRRRATGRGHSDNRKMGNQRRTVHIVPAASFYAPSIPLEAIKPVAECVLATCKLILERKVPTSASDEQVRETIAAMKRAISAAPCPEASCVVAKHAVEVGRWTMMPIPVPVVRV